MSTDATAAADVTLRALYAAFNDRDLSRMLSILHPDIELQPLRLSGGDFWRGHAGITALFGEMAGRSLTHALAVDSVAAAPDGRFVVLGTVTMDGATVPFIGLHTLDAGLVRKSEHRFAIEETLQVLGLD